MHVDRPLPYYFVPRFSTRWIVRPPARCGIREPMSLSLCTLKEAFDKESRVELYTLSSDLEGVCRGGCCLQVLVPWMTPQMQGLSLLRRHWARNCAREVSSHSDMANPVLSLSALLLLNTVHLNKKVQVTCVPISGYQSICFIFQWQNRTW